MKLLTAFLAGFLAGVAASGIYVLWLRQTIKLYRSYIHDRIDNQWEEAKKGSVPRRRNTA